MRLLAATERTLKELKRSLDNNPRSAAVRLAHVWTKRTANSAYDLMFRLQVLEGVSGVSAGAWSEKPSRGVRRAMDHFSDNQEVLDNWLPEAKSGRAGSPTNTGFYQAILDRVKFLSGSLEDVLRRTPDMILTDLFLGLNAQGKPGQNRPLYEVGKILARGITTGSDTPDSVGPGMASKMFRQKVLDEIRNFKRRKDQLAPEDPASVAGGRGISNDSRLWAKNKMKFFGDVLMEDDPKNPLGREIRAWVRAFLGKEPGSQYLLTWFDETLKTKGEWGGTAQQAVKVRDVAKAHGKDPSTVSYYLSSGLTKMRQAFWKTPLARRLEQQFHEENPSSAYHQNMRAAQLSLRHMLRQAFDQFFGVTGKTAASYAGEGLKFRDRYLDLFFREKDLPIVWWNLTARDGTGHTISNQTVLEFLAQAPSREKKGVGNMLRRIDFANGDVNDYLKHLAGAIINGPMAPKLAGKKLKDLGDVLHPGWKIIQESPKETVYSNPSLGCIIRVRHQSHFAHRPIILECSNGYTDDFKWFNDAAKAAESYAKGRVASAAAKIEDIQPGTKLLVARVPIYGSNTPPSYKESVVVVERVSPMSDTYAIWLKGRQGAFKGSVRRGLLTGLFSPNAKYEVIGITPTLKGGSKADIVSEVDKALKVIKAPWSAYLVSKTNKKTPAGEDWEFKVAVRPPQQKNQWPSRMRTELGPSFTFYVTEIQVGPKAGIWYLQTTWSHIGKPDRLHRMEEHRTVVSVGRRIQELLASNGYEIEYY